MKPEKVIPSKVIGYKTPKREYLLDQQNALLYNVSVGYSKDPTKISDLDFTYELSDDFKVNPCIATTTLKIDVVFNTLVECPGMPDFNPMLLLHGE